MFSASTSDGINLWRQRLAPTTFQAAGDLERLTHGPGEAWFPAAAGERLAFVSIRGDIWMMDLKPKS